MKEKGGHVLLSNITTAAVHHKRDVFCAWYKNPNVLRNKFASKVKSVHTQCYDTASSYSTNLLFKRSSLKSKTTVSFIKTMSDCKGVRYVHKDRNIT